jgi:hypothetical protein
MFATPRWADLFLGLWQGLCIIGNATDSKPLDLENFSEADLMATAQESIGWEEIAEFLASGPSPEEILAFRPSEVLQTRARELLLKKNEGSVSWEEERELDEFEQIERFMRLMKAKVRTKKAY